MDSKELRKALSKFATGITVITTTDKDNTPVGVTVNSFTSVSLDPPLVLWCLGDQTFALETYLEAKHFVINILSAEQEQISNNFAIPGEFDRFSNVSYISSSMNMPILDNCLANFECMFSRIERVGDHWVFVGQVRNIVSSEGKPLLYYESDYKKII